MTVQPISDPNTPIGEILEAATSEGLLLESEGRGQYALLPLDDDLIDFLVERNPAFRERCREIRRRMDSGKFQAHDEVKRQLMDDQKGPT